MKCKWFKKAMALGLVSAMAVTGFAGCGTKKAADAGDTNFGWWIFKQDGEGTYYENYEDSPAVQYINAQYWDTKNGGTTDEKNGTKLNLTFQVPIAGSEQANFNTMISTGEYPEIIDMNVSSDTPEALCEAGVGMDITEYVEKYMPNYLDFLDKNPSVKSFVSSQDEDGKTHYYAVYSLRDGVENPWDGLCYRRDWVVKFATPSEYVWDWDSDVVKKDGHPEVTPLAEAKKANNLNGWKKNEVTSFTADYGADPNNDYTDNVIFPSGKTDPYTISDYEWMFEAFEKAIKERGWSSDTSAYCTTIPYNGLYAQGDLVSSFGGGNGTYYVNSDGQVVLDSNSENFKNYVEAMSTWYKNGWLDTEFNTRSSDIFFSINTTGVNQGKVGMWNGMISTVGTVIRGSCANTEDAADAFVMGGALPLNDVYGTDAQKFVEPDCMFQSSQLGAATVVTTKAEGKDLATLFTYFDWCYTMDGALVKNMGLNKEQYASMDLKNDFMADNGYDCAYTESKDENGDPVYTTTVPSGNNIVNALHAGRMSVGIIMGGKGTTNAYTKDMGDTMVAAAARDPWRAYTNTGSVSDYVKILSADQSTKYSDLTTSLTDYMAQNLPDVIKGKKSWDTYSKGVDALEGADDVIAIFQEYVDASKKAAKN